MKPVAETMPDPAAEGVAALSARLDAAAQTRLGRSLALFHVPTGGCGGCERELVALEGVVYDLERFGLRFVTSPRRADVLLATGPLTANLQEALAQSYAAMAEPKWVVAIGDCAVDGGVFKGSYAVHGGVGVAVPVDLLVRGCPPPPMEILSGLLSLLAANGPRQVRPRRRLE
ncbi:NADH-quinone oxidoreductase subunit B family protein [Acidisphaera sp. L21]|uniref:NADH-quinone oxidoreductase subunit B family protein n=1 Tax=Acidisphaera sp. L21 TaxID=1641851 RepID=UPI00131AF3C3|nr:NADH-quinone oxidoreductase subunit NuoB [Acidisphaera sp. L21]